jgi:hypothetical protein
MLFNLRFCNFFRDNFYLQSEKNCSSKILKSCTGNFPAEKVIRQIDAWPGWMPQYKLGGTVS